MLHSNDRIIKHKVGLLNLADELGNISKACKMMGFSRDTFYRYKEAVNEGGVEISGSEISGSVLALLHQKTRLIDPVYYGLLGYCLN